MMKKKRSFFLFLVLLMLFISQETICAWFQKDITVEIDTVMEQKIRELEKELTDAQQIMNINRPNEELLYTRLLLRDPFLFYAAQGGVPVPQTGNSAFIAGQRHQRADYPQLCAGKQADPGRQPPPGPTACPSWAECRSLGNF